MPEPDKLPSTPKRPGRVYLMGALLLANVCFPASHLPAQSACYSDTVGQWRGPVLNGEGIEDMITSFSLDTDGRLFCIMSRTQCRSTVC